MSAQEAALYWDQKRSVASRGLPATLALAARRSPRRALSELAPGLRSSLCPENLTPTPCAREGGGGRRLAPPPQRLCWELSCLKDPRSLRCPFSRRAQHLPGVHVFSTSCSRP